MPNYHKRGFGITQFTPGGTRLTNQPSELSNSYISGAGVGASSTANRRAKIRRSTLFTPFCPPPLPLTGSFIFSFGDNTSSTFRTMSAPSPPPSQDLILAALPVVSVPGIFEINPKITITGNYVYVEIETFLYEQPSYLTQDFGITFNKTYQPPNLPMQPPLELITFFNNINNLTFISSNNCPFSKTGNQFNGLTNIFYISPTFIPYFLPGTSLNSCFKGCTNFNSNISNWDTSTITNMQSMFQEASSFNQDIGNWKVSNVSDMSYMFRQAPLFNQDIGGWNVSKATDMTSMFQSATAFNNGESTNGNSKPLLNWTAPLCLNFLNMFNTATSFNQQLPILVNTAGVSSCLLAGMFSGATLFNQNIGAWNVSKSTNMEAMFQSAIAFNNGGVTTISSWNAELCTTFGNMFFQATSFNQPLTNLLQTHSVTCVAFSMFLGATLFNQNIGTWNVSKVTTMDGMFQNAIAFNNGGFTTISSWSAPLCASFNSMFNAATNFNQPLTNLVVNTTPPIISSTMTSMFRQASLFNQDIGTWNVSKVTTMEAMFHSASAFNNGEITTNLSSNPLNWYAPLCTNFTTMFTSATKFNQSLTNLVVNTTPPIVSSTMGSMFQSAIAFNQDIGGWNVSNVTDMNAMFQSAAAFNNGEITTNLSSKPLNWSAPLCTNFTGMFNAASKFNQKLSTSPTTHFVNTTGVSNCTMNGMFLNASLFNQDIGAWNVSNATNMSIMFQSAIAFNQDIGGWNVSKVTDMNAMFQSAAAFNNGEITTNLSSKPLNWSAPLCTNFTGMFNAAPKFNQKLDTLVDTSTVSVSSCTMNGMFLNALLFNQDIGGWNVSKVTVMTSMFQGATAFNNGEISTNLSSNPLNWSAPLCITFNSMFQAATKFNQSLPNLVVNTPPTVSSTMSAMFQSASLFNQNIGLWNVSRVTLMTSMFSGATAFNQNIGGWDVSKVTNMSSMFQGATAFNNGEISTNLSSNPLNWSAPLCITFNSMFQAATKFNQSLPNLVVNTPPTVSSTMTSMFQSASLFNQNIGLWNVSRVTLMTSMFSGATAFNNGSGTINWTAPICTSFNSMFSGATSFNQPLPNLLTAPTVSSTMTSMFSGATLFNQNIGLWNVSRVTLMNSMFVSARIFNNGESGLADIPNITLSTAFYTNTGRVLNCPGATFVSSLSAGDVLIIQTGTTVYSSVIEIISSNTLLTFTVATAPATSITAPNISSIKKQIPGTSPLNWNTSNVTTLANMFQSATFFNQNITTNGNIWNTNKVTTLASAFNGSTSAITLFNNGQIITGVTAPMGWTFTITPTSTSYRLNCRLTASNKPASLA